MVANASVWDEQSHWPVDSGCTDGGKDPGLPMDVTEQGKS